MKLCAHNGQSALTKISEGNAKEYNGKAFVGLIEKNYKQGVSTEQSICQCLQWLSRANQTPRIRANPTLYQNTRVMVLANISFCYCSLLKFGVVVLASAMKLACDIVLVCLMALACTVVLAPVSHSAELTALAAFDYTDEAMKDGVK